MRRNWNWNWNWNWSWSWIVVGAAVALTLAGPAGAVTVPFTETFAVDNAGWEDNVNDPLAWVPSGGPDGSSYASGSFDFTDFVEPFPGAGPIVFRGNGADDASGDAFVGDWILDGVLELSAFVRHDAPVDLEFIARLAGPQNFPAVALTPPGNVVSPNTWTEIVFEIPGSFCTPESFDPTATCEDILASIGRVQFGTDAPQDLIDQGLSVTFDLDNVTVVPEPGTGLLLGSSLLGLAACTRLRRGRV